MQSLREYMYTGSADPLGTLNGMQNFLSERVWELLDNERIVNKADRKGARKVDMKIVIEAMIMLCESRIDKMPSLL